MYFPMELCSTPHGIGRSKDGSLPLFSIVIVDHCATVIQLWVLLCLGEISGERLQVVSDLTLASVSSQYR